MTKFCYQNSVLGQETTAISMLVEKRSGTNGFCNPTPLTSQLKEKNVGLIFRSIREQLEVIKYNSLVTIILLLVNILLWTVIKVIMRSVLYTGRQLFRVTDLLLSSSYFCQPKTQRRLALCVFLSQLFHILCYFFLLSSISGNHIVRLFQNFLGFLLKFPFKKKRQSPKKKVAFTNLPVYL